MSIILKYIYKGISLFLNANAISLRKSLITELVAHALSLRVYQYSAEGPFKLYVFIC